MKEEVVKKDMRATLLLQDLGTVRAVRKDQG
jgi:hypothetical protein